MSGGDFAELLRALKERSGLSYGALAKRLHMSTSTLHRYVNGEVVPADYAPVERLARVCRATPEELLELHRRWVRADALRGVKPARAEDPSEPLNAPAPPDTPEPSNIPDTPDTPASPDPTPPPATLEASDPAPRPNTPSPPRRRRTAVLAGAGAAVVAAVVAVAVSVVPGEHDAPRTPDGQAAGARLPAAGSGSRTPSAHPATPSRTSTASPSPSPSASEGSPSPGRTAAPSGEEKDTGPVAVTVATTPYYWDVPCEQSFLVDRSPRNVPKPPVQQDAEGWAVALGAVAADHQMVTLTVQGTGARTVVLQALHVRVVGSDKPLAWNKYAMGDGCGGGVNTKSFDVALDLGNPLAMPVAGQRNFPYKVSESDPEVFYVNAHTSGHDVRWYLELEWSSGTRQGTVRVDDHGRPFRTSGSQKPYYVYPLGGSAWEPVSGD
ncbi:transcriptional regulator [Streptomyces sp. Ru71]|uniref:helix-turn-helix domain-containing protein n=1 Tax=Streptomyces sp. Ru71 TaxID=2080746 RepID=UPI000CDD180A|nr:helix-turn-helix transcriptional regulator [Streptomyces sp. Ru71]POX46275.1 transcriptional regulator [Streptomyces sp. Ru71]